MSRDRAIAMMCCACELPFWGHLNDRRSVMQWQCETCGEQIMCLTFYCECTEKPVYAVPPDGVCERCGSALMDSQQVDSEHLSKLRELLKREAKRHLRFSSRSESPVTDTHGPGKGQSRRRRLRRP